MSVVQWLFRIHCITADFLMGGFTQKLHVNDQQTECTEDIMFMNVSHATQHDDHFRLHKL